MDKILEEAGKYESLITVLALIVLIWYTVETFLLRKSAEKQIKLIKRQIASDLVPKVMLRNAYPKGDPVHIRKFHNYRKEASEISPSERTSFRNKYFRDYISKDLNPGVYKWDAENLSNSDVYDVEILMLDKKLDQIFTANFEHIPAKGMEETWLRSIPVSLKEALNQVNDKYGRKIRKKITKVFKHDGNVVISISLDRLGNIYMSGWSYSYVAEERIYVSGKFIDDIFLER